MNSNEGGPANDRPGAPDPTGDGSDGGDIARDPAVSDDRPPPGDDDKHPDGQDAIDLDSVRDRAS